MYFAVGWPKYYGVNDVQTGQPCGFKFNRDRSILAVLTEDRLTLWHFHVSTLFGVTNYHDHEILEAPINVNHPLACIPCRFQTSRGRYTDCFRLLGQLPLQTFRTV